MRIVTNGLATAMTTSLMVSYVICSSGITPVQERARQSHWASSTELSTRKCVNGHHQRKTPESSPLGLFDNLVYFRKKLDADLQNLDATRRCIHTDNAKRCFPWQLSGRSSDQSHRKALKTVSFDGSGTT